MILLCFVALLAVVGAGLGAWAGSRVGRRSAQTREPWEDDEDEQPEPASRPGWVLAGGVGGAIVGAVAGVLLILVGLGAMAG